MQSSYTTRKLANHLPTCAVYYGIVPDIYRVIYIFCIIVGLKSHHLRKEKTENTEYSVLIGKWVDDPTRDAISESAINDFDKHCLHHHPQLSSVWLQTRPKSPTRTSLGFCHAAPMSDAIFKCSCLESGRGRYCTRPLQTCYFPSSPCVLAARHGPKRLTATDSLQTWDVEVGGV